MKIGLMENIKSRIRNLETETELEPEPDLELEPVN